MPNDSIQKALDSINKIILKICITAIVIILIIVCGFSSILLYDISKTYDYEYPTTDIINTNNNSNNNGGE